MTKFYNDMMKKFLLWQAKHGGEGDLMQRPANNGISVLFATDYQAD